VPDGTSWLELLDFGVTAVMAVGLMWMYHKNFADIAERLGEIIGMLRYINDTVTELHKKGGE